MNELAPSRFALGEYTLDPAARELRRGDEQVPLARLPFRVLVYLVENRDRVVTRTELIDRFWDGKDVYDDTLHKCVGAIRKALGDSASRARFVETRHGEGYRYVGPFGGVALDERAEIEIETTRAVGVVIEHETDAAAPRRITVSAPRRLAVGVALAAVAAVALAGVALRTRTPEAAALPPVPSMPRSVAVLPLENLSGDANDEYLGDGLAESLINDLSRVNGLKVISRRSAFAFKATPTDPREVGRRLGVESILEGSVRRAGDEVRVEVRLVSTDDGRVLWAGDAAGRLTGNELDVEEALACEVAAGLRVSVCGEGARVASRYTRNAGAYRECLAGRYYWNKRSDSDLREAVRHFEAALAADPDYAPAYSGLAETYAIMEANSNAAPGAVAAKGAAAARRALELDDGQAGAWAALGLLAANGFDWAEADRCFGRALELNPGYASARQWHSGTLLVRGRFEEAEAELLRARETDPLSYPVANSLASLYYHSRKFDLAVSGARAALDLDPSGADASFTMAMAYLALGRNDEALAAGDRVGGEAARIVRTFVTGDAGEQRRYVDSLARSSFGARMPYSVATLYARIGDGESALRWLERAVALHQADAAMLGVASEFDSLRSDPRYAALARRVGLDT
jgi:TolB-like protein/DNA-binding winged helix-turn-helix (wHTH) protein